MFKKHPTKLTNEEIKDILEFQGTKLSLLISRLNLSPQEKEKLFKLLESLSLEQLLIFTEYLESGYLNEQTREADEEFMKKISDLKTAFDEENQGQSEKVMNQLNDIEQRINQGKEGK